MATGETITLNVDLYDNTMTANKGDYIGRPRTTGSLHNRDIAARIVAERTEYRQETIENILNLADQKKVEAIAEGKSVIDGVGQYILTVRGTFVGENAQFDRSSHSLKVSYSSGQLLREGLKKVKVVCNGVGQTGPVINSVRDATSNSDALTSGGPLVISGSNLKIGGDDPTVGVYLTVDEPDATPVKVPLIVHNVPSQLTVMLPTIEDGKLYTLKVVTQYSHGKLVKGLRTYTYPILLSNEGSGEAPDPIDPTPGGDGDGEAPDPLA